MKLLLFFLISLVVSSFASAKVLTVSNNPALPAQYADVNPAIAAASPGDTIYIHGSPNWYGNTVYLDKRLVLVGPGHQPKSTSKQIALLQALTISNKAANGSAFYGLSIYSTIQGSSLQLSDTVNLTFKYCSIGTYFGTLNINFSFTSMVVENCLFINGTLSVYSLLPVKTGLLVRNCIFSTPGGSGPVSLSNLSDNAIVDHNVFIGNVANARAFGSAVNCTFSNNIIFGRVIDTTGSISNSGCVFLNNITYYCDHTLPTIGNTGSGNINADPMFVNFPSTPALFSYSQDFHLAPGSPGKNAATDGTDIGVYGGSVNFSFTGEPDEYPVIRTLDIYNTTVPPGGTLDIRMKSSVPVRN